MIFLGLVVLAVVISLTVFLYIKLSPQFGQVPDGNDLKRMEKSSNYRQGLFQNSEKTSLDWPFEKMTKVFYKFLFVKGEREPAKEIPQINFTAADLEIHRDSNMRLRWFGHSAFYLEIDGKRLLLDPMLGNIASPLSFMGPERFNKNLPISIEELPFIDAVIYSHDHYDHLDYSSVIGLKDKVGHWFTALGMGSHLKKWGIDSAKITEMDWWEEKEFMGLKLAATPARHFSGRAINDRFKTFWNSWVIRGRNQNLFFSGDGGYSKEFKRIGEKFGPFDICLIECGAYNEDWHDIHMMPEESAQACVDLSGRLMMPIHWGAFSLALHSWTEPVTRLSKKAEELGVRLVTPVIGEEVIVPVYIPDKQWWQDK